MALFLNKMKYLVMPALVMSLANLATVMRFTRSSMVETLNPGLYPHGQGQRTFGKGGDLPPRTEEFPDSGYHHLRLIHSEPVRGRLYHRKVFSWPGMGLLGVDAIANRDYAVLMGLTLFTAILVLVGNLVADILYSFVDPRIRY